MVLLLKNIHNRRIPLFVALALGMFLALTHISSDASRNEQWSDQVPEFAYPYSDQQEFWINSPPLSVKSLRGKVFMIEFWTYGCINCRRSIPWVKHIEEKFSKEGFTVIGIHTPEFKHEREKASVREAVKKLRITHPVMIDNDFIYWKDMGNRYWPAFHLVDGAGKVIESFVGEVHVGTEKAGRIERLIAELL